MGISLLSSTPYTATTVAEQFLDRVYRLHGLPQSLVSDRDPVFTSSFWKEVCNRTGIKLLMSSGQHPQTDGQTERVNQQVEGYLRCFISAHRIDGSVGFLSMSCGIIQTGILRLAVLRLNWSMDTQHIILV